MGGQCAVLPKGTVRGVLQDSAPASDLLDGSGAARGVLLGAEESETAPRSAGWMRDNREGTLVRFCVALIVPPLAAKARVVTIGHNVESGDVGEGHRGQK